LYSSSVSGTLAHNGDGRIARVAGASDDLARTLRVGVRASGAARGSRRYVEGVLYDGRRKSMAAMWARPRDPGTY